MRIRYSAEREVRLETGGGGDEWTLCVGKVMSPFGSLNGDVFIDALPPITQLAADTLAISG